jgi:mRNA degradation ribonuclease J1/J2
MSHSIPGTFGFVFRTKDGNLIYLTDYIFEKISEYKGLEPSKFAQLSQEKNLLLLSDSSAISSVIRDTSIDMKKYIKNKGTSQLKDGRVIFSIYDQDIKGIVNILNEAKKINKKVIIYGLTASTNINKMMKNGVIDKFTLLPYTDIGKKEIYDDL